MTAAEGIPAMAATSLRQRPRALWPTLSGGVSAAKWIPSTTASVFSRSSLSGSPKSSTAQSSPGPTTTDLLVGNARVRRAINSNSFTVLRRLHEFILERIEHGEIGGVEKRVGGDRCEEIVGAFIQQ